MTSPPPPRRFRLIRVGQLALLAAAAAFAVITLVHRPAAADAGMLLRTGITLLSGVLCVLRAVMLRGERAPWAVLGAGILSYGAANTYFSLAIGDPEAVGTASLAHAGWLLFYPACYTALILLLRRRVLRFHPSLWLDALVGLLGVAALASGIGAELARRQPEDNLWMLIVNLTYPLADLLLVLLVATVFGLLDWRPGRVFWLLGIGLVGFAVADSLLIAMLAGGEYDQGGALEIVWVLSLLTPAFAAWRREAWRRPARMSGWGVIAVPLVMSAVALALLVAGATWELPLVTVILAGATILAALARGTITFFEMQRLAESVALARTDELTGLANRRGFIERLTRAAQATGEGDSLALLLLDLDGFKLINDSLGHQVGDAMLIQVGSRIAGALRPGDMHARLGGDEFAILLEQADAEAAHLVADRVLDSLANPFDVGGMSVHVGASIGAALFPDHADDPHMLLRRADVAMYTAKASRAGVECYRPGADVNTLLQLDTIESLRSALGTGQLEVHYQVKVGLESGRADGVEALVRWRHPTRGLLSPEAFVPLAEQAGLMRMLTIEVLQTSLAQCRRWRQAGLDLAVAVNVSASDLLDRSFPEQVRGLLARYDLKPSALELEITETTLMLDRVRIAAVLGELRDLGIQIAVDDYGTGYSSLAYLQELPVDMLKMDKSFTMKLEHNKNTEAIVRSTVWLAHALGLRIVVEGVETAGALRMLQEFGCDLAQGYYLGHPRPAEEITELLAMQDQGRVPTPTGARRRPSRLSSAPAAAPAAVSTSADGPDDRVVPPGDQRLPTRAPAGNLWR